MNRALVEGVLAGYPFPARRREFLDLARSGGAPTEVGEALEELPDLLYRSPNEVGEALAPVQPPRPARGRPLPRPESGDPPGGERYLGRDVAVGAGRAGGAG